MIKFNEVTWYSKLAAIIFFLGIFPVLTFYIGTRYQEAKDFSIFVIEQPERSGVSIEKIVSDYIDNEMSGNWDKKVEIKKISTERDAYIGKWYNKDAWPWIAYKDSREWRVLISRDGFDCTLLKAIPIKYNEFFKEIITNTAGNPECYDWTLKN